MKVLSLSVLVPVYNEQYLVTDSLNRLKILETCAELSRVEIIVVDDGSSDDTPRVLEAFRQRLAAGALTDAPGKISWIFRRHDINRGKGEAVKTALVHATCDVTVIHDSDLE